MTNQSDTTAVLAADDRRLAAVQASDAKALDGLLASDFSYTHAVGRREDRATYLASVADGHASFLDLRRLEGQVRFYGGDVAVLEGRWLMRFTLAGETEVRDREPLFTSVWVRQSGQWRLAAHVNVSQPAG